MENSAQNMAEELNQIKGDIASTRREVSVIGSNVDKIMVALSGDSLNGDGIVKKVAFLDLRVKKLEDDDKADGWMNKIFWVAVGAIVMKAITSIL